MTSPPPPSALSAANSNASAGVQPMLSAIEFALNRVQEIGIVLFIMLWSQFLILQWRIVQTKRRTGRR